MDGLLSKLHNAQNVQGVSAERIPLGGWQEVRVQPGAAGAAAQRKQEAFP